MDRVAWTHQALCLHYILRAKRGPVHASTISFQTDHVVPRSVDRGEYPLYNLEAIMRLSQFRSVLETGP